jgi:hypothetical protein
MTTPRLHPSTSYGDQHTPSSPNGPAGSTAGPAGARCGERTLHRKAPLALASLGLGPGAAKPVFVKSVLKNLPECAAHMRLIHVTRASSTSAAPVPYCAGRSAGMQCPWSDKHDRGEQATAPISSEQDAGDVFTSFCVHYGEYDAFTLPVS